MRRRGGEHGQAPEGVADDGPGEGEVGSIFVIGDVHGCFATLEGLWQQLPFRSDRDQLWMAGDLVNRGPRSHDVLRWARSREEELGERFQSVLGNHDLHLLAVAHGVAPLRPKDTLADLLVDSAGDAAIDWLRRRPLMVRRRGGPAMVHAGLLPDWSLDEAERRARRGEAGLVGDEASSLLSLYAAANGAATPVDLAADTATPSARCRAAATGAELAFDLSVLSRIRACDRQGRLSGFSGPPNEAPPGQRPWFERHTGLDETLFFGHWAALGLHLGARAVCVDSGCVWGRRLSAVRWPDLRVFQQPRVD